MPVTMTSSSGPLPLAVELGACCAAAGPARVASRQVEPTSAGPQPFIANARLRIVPPCRGRTILVAEAPRSSADVSLKPNDGSAHILILQTVVRGRQRSGTRRAAGRTCREFLE